MDPEIAVLILTHNGEKLLGPTLDSVLKSTIKTNIVVIDNDSTDSSRDIVRNKYPMVELIENKKNYTFGQAYNRVMPKRKEPYLLIINDDVILEPDGIENAYRLLKKNKKAGGVLFLEFLMDEPLEFPYERDYIFKKRFGVDFGSHVRFETRKDPPKKVIFFWGVCSLIRTELVKKVGFDEDFSWYFEDIDLGWSICNRFGTYFLVCPDCIAHHMSGAATKKLMSTWDRDRKNHHNSMLSFAKNATTRQMVRGAPEMFYQLMLQKDRVALLRLMKYKRKHERNLPEAE